MEDNNSDEKRYSCNPHQVILQIEEDSTSSTSPPLASPTESTSKTTKEVEVCYPYQNQNGNSTIDAYILKEFLENHKEESTDPDFRHERQLTAKLDDLLDSGEKTSRGSRRFSMYGGNVVVTMFFFCIKIGIYLFYNANRTQMI